MRHVRDGGLGLPEEREARHPHFARGRKERGKAWDVGADVGSV